MLIQEEAELVVRTGRPGDLEAIRDLQLLSLRVLAVKDYSPLELRALLRSKSELRSWDEIYFVAESAGQIVGFASLAKGRPWVNALFVHPEFTRQGIATQLFAALETEARRQRYRALWVMSSLTGEAFYRSVGFELLKPTAIAIAAGPRIAVPCLHMKKILLSGTQVSGVKSRYKPGEYQANSFGATLANLGWMLLGALAVVVLGQVLKGLIGG